MRYILLISILVSVVMMAYSSQSITIPDITDTLYIGQVIATEIDLSKNQPERLYMDRRQSKESIEFFDLQSLPERPWHYLLRIAAFDTGYVQTERFPIYALTEGVTDTIFVEPFSFYVKSSITFSDTLQDIAPPTAFSLKFWDYAFPLAVLILLACAIYLANRFLWVQKQKQEMEVIDTRPAWQKAMALLTIFKQKHYLEDGEYLDFFFDLSIIFRCFIEWQYGIKAVEMTTFEIKQALEEIEKKREIISILGDMDMVKFAKFIPDANRARDILLWIEDYILSFSSEGHTDV